MLGTCVGPGSVAQFFLRGGAVRVQARRPPDLGALVPARATWRPSQAGGAVRCCWCGSYRRLLDFEVALGEQVADLFDVSDVVSDKFEILDHDMPPELEQLRQ